LYACAQSPDIVSHPQPHTQKFNVPLQPKFCAGGNPVKVHNIHVFPLTNDGLTVNDPNKLPETLPVNEVIDTFQTVNQELLLSIPSKSVIVIVSSSQLTTKLKLAVLLAKFVSVMNDCHGVNTPVIVYVSGVTQFTVTSIC